MTTLLKLCTHICICMGMWLKVLSGANLGVEVSWCLKRFYHCIWVLSIGNSQVYSNSFKQWYILVWWHFLCDASIFLYTVLSHLYPKHVWCFFINLKNTINAIYHCVYMIECTSYSPMQSYRLYEYPKSRPYSLLDLLCCHKLFELINLV